MHYNATLPLTPRYPNCCLPFMFFSNLQWGTQTIVFHLCFPFQTKACIPPPSHMFLGILYFYTMLWISELQKDWHSFYNECSVTTGTETTQATTTQKHYILTSSQPTWIQANNAYIITQYWRQKQRKCSMVIIIKKKITSRGKDIWQINWKFTNKTPINQRHDSQNTFSIWTV